MRGHIVSNQRRDAWAGVIVSVLFIAGVGQYIFSDPPPEERPEAAIAAPVKISTVDAPFLAGNPGLQAAHAQGSNGDGFSIIITMKTTGCPEAVSAKEISRHRYEVICSAGSSGHGTTKFMVDTDTGFVMGT